MTIGLRQHFGAGWMLVLALSPAVPAFAEDVNCANEFRSGKLYFSQKLYDKAVSRFGVAAEACPDKAEYRARYAMALAQYADIMIEPFEVTGDLEGYQAVVDSARTMYRMAGSEFDAALAAEDTKKNIKFVTENRRYFWVDRYNKGLKLLQEEKPAVADLEFELARLVDPTDPKAYSQGAIALIGLGSETDAAALVQEGLARDPKDETLNELLETIYLNAALKLTRQSEESKDPAPAAEAESYYTQVLDRRGGEDANVLFDRGVARLAKGAALASASGGDSISAEAAEAFRASAADFHRAGELTPAETDTAFFMSTLFNEAQATLNAGDLDQARDLFKTYLALDCKDPAIWQLLAQALVARGDTNIGVSALMISKSVANQAIPVEEAIKTADGDAKAALDASGKPDYVYYYQDPGGDQITTWMWCGKTKAACYRLNEQVAELSWAK